MTIHDNKNKWDIILGVLLGIMTGVGIASLTMAGYFDNLPELPRESTLLIFGIIPMLMMHDLSCLLISSFNAFGGVGIKACYKNNYFAELISRIFRLILVMGAVRLGILFLMYLVTVNRIGEPYPLVYIYGFEKMEPRHLMSFAPMVILFPIIMFYVRSQGMLFNYREKEFYAPEYINTKLYHKMAQESAAAGFNSGQDALRNIPKGKNNVKLKSWDLTSLFYGSFQEKMYKTSGTQQRKATTIFNHTSPVSFDFTEKDKSQPKSSKIRKEARLSKETSKEISKETKLPKEREQSAEKYQEKGSEGIRDESIYDREKITRKRRN